MKFSEKTTLHLKQAVAKALPTGNGFKILVEPTRASKAHVLRVVTPAWSNKPRFDRVVKLQQAIFPILSTKEKAQVFRLSVLTPDEWMEIKNDADLGPRKFTEVVRQNAMRPKSLSTQKTAAAKPVSS